MFGKMKDMYDLQKKAKEVQQALDDVRVEKKSKDGLVQRVMNGNHRVVSLFRDDSLLIPSHKAQLEKTRADLISQACEEIRQRGMTEAYGMMKGLGNLPNLGG